VGSGEEALDRLEAASDLYSLLVLDLGLPGIDGFTVLEAVRARPATSRLPVLVFTGRELSLDEKRRLQVRMADVMRKGDGAGLSLVEAVAQAIGRPAGTNHEATR
jgi:CheY-like chemotaxis protein